MALIFIKVVYAVKYAKYVTESGLVLSALHQKPIAYIDCLYKGGTQIKSEEKQKNWSWLMTA